MGWIEKTSEKFHKAFSSKRLLKRFYALYDAIDTFLLTPNSITKKGSHIRDVIDMKRIMITVMIALIPPLLFGIWNIGYQHFLAINIDANFWQTFWFGFLKWLPIVLVVYASGLTVEVIFAQRLGHSVAEGFFVTGMLIPMIVPPEIPLWILALATIFATLFAKEVFGGTGYNFLNVALVARAFIFFAYPSVISGDNVWIADKPDAISGATPLALLSNGDVANMPSMLEMFIGTIPGSIGETSKLAILLGGIFLIYTQVANWRIMLSVILGGLSMGFIFNLIGTTPIMQIPPYDHLLMGGFMFGAVYMATDPVTSPHTNWGRIVFGFLIGVIAVVIRVINKGYPEGMMLAILLMNVFAPLIDYIAIQNNIRKRKKRLSKLNLKNITTQQNII
ncbi:NADH:ubiquinone reductase (Na(+)-transporting) subunit B [Bacteroidales bacterium OttesenSCG-928-K03]|nr:NADH:ubiquinone reductase (Na(+)-transporting) subunit B [Bacteroidales bacterium OttesenSCG-928-K22]MDL2242508.1 NADH:ubiquinone reductase (Na(+)-transporting) subunit B [Bacteroidales bacterium OttesenSCG-928-K03]